MLHRPLRFGLCLTVLFGLGHLLPEIYNPPLHAARTFFGVHQVRLVEGVPLEAIDRRTGSPTVLRIPFHQLIHGTTRHGSQAQNEQLRRTPTTYYHHSGPIGQLFEALDGRGVTDRVALIGLGAGTLAAYGGPGARFTFFEIDPEVAAIARDPRWFTYLSDSRARIEIVIGDGRLSLAKRPDGEYGLIVVDAFSSDSVPVHLITRQAVELYLRKLEPRGVVAFHLSSQYLDLIPVVDSIADSLGLVGLAQTDETISLGNLVEGKEASTWCVLARDRDSLGALQADPRWEPLPRVPREAADGRYLWTDDFSNVLGTLRLFGVAGPSVGPGDRERHRP